jgi:hypothetical protein
MEQPGSRNKKIQPARPKSRSPDKKARRLRLA